MIAFALVWTAIGSVVWMFCCDGLPAEVRLRRMAKGKRTRTSHVVLSSIIRIVAWPQTALLFIARRGVWL